MINLLFFVLSLILWAANTLLFYKSITHFLTLKKSSFFRILAIIAFIPIVGIVIFPEDMINVTVVFFAFLLIALICFREPPLQKVAVVFIFFPLIIAINFLFDNVGMYTYLALGGVLRQDLGSIIYDNSKYMLLSYAINLAFGVIRTGFWFLIYRLFTRRLPNAKTLLTMPMWGMIGVICLAPIAGTISLVLFTPSFPVLVYPAMLSTIITIIGILLIIGYIGGAIKTEAENKNLRTEKVYYNELEKNQQETAKLRHDMNNHLSVIATFLISDEKEKARAYYQSLSGELEAKNRVFCKNSIVNAVINAKYNSAMSEEIDCFFNIDLGNILSIDDISLCSIFANTLDNAIEACQLIPDVSRRNISLQARYLNEYFSFEITNAKANEVVAKKGVFHSKKPNSKSHGYGISNVKSIVESYNGDMDISYTNDSFTVTILIKI